VDDESRIIRVVDMSVESICEEFRLHSTRFYTENDIVCRLYSLLHDSLPHAILNDVDSRSQSLIHTEYPTPFKCDMDGTRFDVADPDSRFHRGHYDLVVLSPKFVTTHSYTVTYGQKFSQCMKTIIPWSEANGPFILYGLEFMLRRKPENKQRDRWNAWDNRMAEFRQDCDKLSFSREQGFIRKAKGLFFIRERSEGLERQIANKVPKDGIICWGSEK
jgi:hypothetical protein